MNTGSQPFDTFEDTLSGEVDITFSTGVDGDNVSFSTTDAIRNVSVYPPVNFSAVIGTSVTAGGTIRSDDGSDASATAGTHAAHGSGLASLFAAYSGQVLTGLTINAVGDDPGDMTGLLQVDQLHGDVSIAGQGPTTFEVYNNNFVLQSLGKDGPATGSITIGGDVGSLLFERGFEGDIETGGGVTPLGVIVPFGSPAGDTPAGAPISYLWGGQVDFAWMPGFNGYGSDLAAAPNSQPGSVEGGLKGDFHAEYIWGNWFSTFIEGDVNLDDGIYGVDPYFNGYGSDMPEAGEFGWFSNPDAPLPDGLEEFADELGSAVLPESPSAEVGSSSDLQAAFNAMGLDLPEGFYDDLPADWNVIPGADDVTAQGDIIILLNGGIIDFWVTGSFDGDLDTDYDNDGLGQIGMFPHTPPVPPSPEGDPNGLPPPVQGITKEFVVGEDFDTNVHIGTLSGTHTESIGDWDGGVITIDHVDPGAQLIVDADADDDGDGYLDAINILDGWAGGATPLRVAVNVGTGGLGELTWTPTVDGNNMRIAINSLGDIDLIDLTNQTGLVGDNLILWSFEGTTFQASGIRIFPDAAPLTPDGNLGIVRVDVDAPEGNLLALPGAHILVAGDIGQILAGGYVSKIGPDALIAPFFIVADIDRATDLAAGVMEGGDIDQVRAGLADGSGRIWRTLIIARHSEVGSVMTQATSGDIDYNVASTNPGTTATAWMNFNLHIFIPFFQPPLLIPLPFPEISGYRIFGWIPESGGIDLDDHRSPHGQGIGGTFLLNGGYIEPITIEVEDLGGLVVGGNSLFGGPIGPITWSATASVSATQTAAPISIHAVWGPTFYYFRSDEGAAAWKRASTRATA